MSSAATRLRERLTPVERRERRRDRAGRRRRYDEFVVGEPQAVGFEATVSYVVTDAEVCPPGYGGADCAFPHCLGSRTVLKSKTGRVAAVAETFATCPTDDPRRGRGVDATQSREIAALFSGPTRTVVDFDTGRGPST